MSIVGTRPPLISETNLYEPHHKVRLAIKPGITGMWQVSGRSDITDFEEVVRLDKEYMGCKDMIVAASGDGILIADKERSGYMKPYVEKIETEATVSVQRAGKSVRLRPTCNFDVFDI